MPSNLFFPRWVAALALVIFSLIPQAHADVRLAALFSDHMVLQQAAAVPVWGTAKPGEKITVQFGAQKVTTRAGKDGKWTVRLTGLKAGGPGELIVSGKNQLTVHDVYVGEVWLCSGQSNMDMRVARGDRYWCGVTNEAAEVAAANFPLIRTFYVKLKLTDVPQPNCSGEWIPCSPATVGEFSATAYFFARELHQKLHVPIGIVVSSFGASTAEAWVSRPALLTNPAYTNQLAKYEAAVKTFATNPVAKMKYAEATNKWELAKLKAKAEGKAAPKGPKNPDPGQDQHNPCVLFNGMIAPLAPYAIRGAIWYQGESNVPNAPHYFSLMQTLIGNWRQVWAQGDFPFLFVQLANLKPLATNANARAEIALLREAQQQTLAVTNTAMVTAVDIGDAANIHPKNKQEVGRRLGLAARALVYGEPIPSSGPTFDSMAIEAGSIRLHFTHTDGGLVARGGELKGFAIASDDLNYVWADAKIDGDTVVVSNATVSVPTNVRYGWADNPPLSLYNGAGLPALPFRTDK